FFLGWWPEYPNGSIEQMCFPSSQARVPRRVQGDDAGICAAGRKKRDKMGLHLFPFSDQALTPTANATQGTKLVPPLMVATTSVAAIELIESSTRIDFSGEVCSLTPLCGGVIWVWDATITTTYARAAGWARGTIKPLTGSMPGLPVEGELLLEGE